jgi:hypothetical protein
MKYPAVERLKYSEITTPTYGVLIDDKGAQRPMSGIRLAAHLRERERASPRLLVRALENPQSISALPDQQIGQSTLPAVSITSGGNTFIVLFDRGTHLPAAIRIRDADNVYGDSNYDMILSDWKDVAGTKRAHALSFQINGMEVHRGDHRGRSRHHRQAGGDRDCLGGELNQAAAGGAGLNPPLRRQPPR